MSPLPSLDAGQPAVGPHTPAAPDRSLVHGVAWLGGLKWIVQLVTWTITIAVARMLTPQDYGLVSMAVVLLGFAIALARYSVPLTNGRRVRLAAEMLAGVMAYSVSLLVLHRPRVRRFLQLWRPDVVLDAEVTDKVPAQSDRAQQPRRV